VKQHSEEEIRAWLKKQKFTDRVLILTAMNISRICYFWGVYTDRIKAFFKRRTK
jgi:hypothetical protein